MANPHSDYSCSTRQLSEMGWIDYHTKRYPEAFAPWTTKLQQCLTVSPQKKTPPSPSVGLENVRKLFGWCFAGLMIATTVLLVEVFKVWWKRYQQEKYSRGKHFVGRVKMRRNAFAPIPAGQAWIRSHVHRSIRKNAIKCSSAEYFQHRMH